LSFQVVRIKALPVLDQLSLLPVHGDHPFVVPFH
jgi:hypothetical protein